MHSHSCHGTIVIFTNGPSSACSTPSGSQGLDPEGAETYGYVDALGEPGRPLDDARGGFCSHVRVDLHIMHPVDVRVL